MTNIIDRRLNSNNKSLVNRQKFLKRAKESIKKSIKENIKTKNIKDVTNGDMVNIPIKDISEPTFRHNKTGGSKDYVLPGNKEFIEGDQVKKPNGGSGNGSGNNAGGDGEGNDEFVFSLSKEEFLDFFFEDLELPNLVKKNLKETKTFKLKYSGITKTGNPANIDKIRSFKNSISRRVALRRPDVDELEELKANLLIEKEKNPQNLDIIEELSLIIQEKERLLKIIPFIDEMDIRYKYFTPHPIPNSSAVMFCLMDISGSMGEREKDISKRFFMLLYLFLQRKYDVVDIIFIRHHSIAEEVDEQKFFYDTATGGTIVSTALEKMNEIIKERYPISDWNIYAAQASDGENISDSDNQKCRKILEEQLLPISQYFAYIEIIRENYHPEYYSQTMWNVFYQITKNFSNMATRRIGHVKEIYPVFRELFEKKDNK